MRCEISMGWAFVALLMAGCAAGREWRDERGRVVIRADGDGRQLYYTWDDADRLLRIDGIGEAGCAWTHVFSYSGSGALICEITCTGQWHTFNDNRAIDRERGTALAEHMHRQARESVERPARYEYDADPMLHRVGDAR